MRAQAAARTVNRPAHPANLPCGSRMSHVPYEREFDSTGYDAGGVVSMADILQFPGRQLDIIAQLDASIMCIRRLRAASRLPSDKVRTEALGARLDIAGFREAMGGALTSTAATSGHSAEIECAWDRLEDLLDQVSARSSYFYDESYSEESYAMRGQLRVTCRSTLAELDCLRSLLLPDYAES
jgi:hypothetical protein